MFERFCALAQQGKRKAVRVSRDYKEIEKSLSTCTAATVASSQHRAQVHMDSLVDLYIFAWSYEIENLKHDILQALSLVIQVGRQLPDLKILNKAFSANPTSQLSTYLKDVYDINWSASIAAKFKAASNENLHSGVVDILVRNLVEDLETSQMEKENLSQTMEVTKAKQALKDKQIINELAKNNKALAEAKAQISKKEQAAQKEKETRDQLAKAKKALTEAQAKISQLEKDRVTTSTQKRARVEHDEIATCEEIDTSEAFRQSLKRPCRTLRPRTSGVSKNPA
jgi:hypothetical protein